jgi:hypothetical protein
MILRKAEHLTRYTLFYQGLEYLRLVEKGTEEEKVSWLVFDEKGGYMIGDTEEAKLETLFLQTVQ